MLQMNDTAWSTSTRADGSLVEADTGAALVPPVRTSPRAALRLSEAAAGHLLALTAGRPLPQLGQDATPTARAAVLALMRARGVTVGATALDPVPVRHRQR